MATDRMHQFLASLARVAKFLYRYLASTYSVSQVQSGAYREWVNKQ
jgi:hypothetical protein